MSTPPYDVNFCYPVCELENDQIKLTPFIPDQHADLFFQASSPHPELYQHLPFGPYPSAAAFTQHFLHGRIQPDPANMLYAILDSTRVPAPTLAGIMGYLRAAPANLSVEIGFAIVLPPFQRTHVATHAVGLLLRYALDPPTASPPGLGLRRVQWQANDQNAASIRLAERMGFRREGHLRWDRVFAGDRGKAGNGAAIRAGDPMPGTLGRHTVLLAICWDDWENGGREHVARLMGR